MPPGDENALTPEQIAAILGTGGGRSPEEEEQVQAARDGFGSDVDTWRTYMRRSLDVEMQKALQALTNAQRSGSNDAGNLGARWSELAQQARQFDARMGMDTRQLDEQIRQFNESFGANKARFNIEQQLDEAKFGWQQAVDSRDFEAAEAWREKYHGLDLRRQGQSEYTDEAGISQGQNRLTMDYLNFLASQQGPDDWVKYWDTSRGRTTARGDENIPFEQAVPAFAQPRALPDRSSFMQNVQSSLPAGPTTGQGGGGGATPPPAFAYTAAPQAAPGQPQSVFTKTAAPAGFADRIASANTTDVSKQGPVAVGPGGQPVFIDPDRVAEAQARLRQNNPGRSFGPAFAS